MYFEKILPNNWIGVRRNFQKIDSYLFGPTAEPTFNSITLAGLTASRLVWTDADKAFESKDLVDLVTGTANEIDIADDGDGSITVGLVNPLITAKGGTGLATLTDHGLLLGSGTGAVTPLAEASNGQIPIGSTGNDPVLATITGTAKRVTVANTAGTITLSGPQDLDTVDSPTFAGATIGSLGGIVLATAGVLSAITNNSAHWDTAYSHSQLASGNPHSVTPTELGLVIGTNTQAWDASLDSIAALTYASASFIKLTAEDTYAVRTIAETKSDLSLNLVENTALSSWAGSGNITTVGALASGSIATGFTEIAVDFTAAKCTDATADNTAGNETSHADVVVDGDVGTSVQAWDASLDSIAALTYASASFIKLTAEDTYAVRTIAETKSDLSLNLVENTALSSWAGSGNITTVGALASGSIATGFTEIAVDFTAAKCTDATADNTAGNETSHADVVVDGDFASNGILNRTGAGAYSILVLGSDVQAYHANLAAIVAGSWTGANSITTLGTIATGTWEATDVGIAHGGTGQSTAQAAINALSAVGAATNEHVLTKDTGTGNAIWKAAAGGGSDDIGVAVYSNANLVITTGGVGTKLTFNQERWDTDTCHDNATNNTRLTCKTAGKYIITGCVTFAANAAGYRWVYILLNNTTNIGEQGFMNAGIYYARVGCSAIYNLAVNDYIELVVFQDCGVSKVIIEF